MNGEFETWRWLLTPAAEALVRRAAACESFDPAAIASLRRDATEAQARAAIELVLARRKAAAKFAHADRMLVDVEGVEQASSDAVARHKAARFAERGMERACDLCCGIGGDAMALARHTHLWTFDADPVRALMSSHNVGIAGGDCRAVAVDVTTQRWAGRAVHVDPSRRSADRRTHRYADLRPGPAFIAQLLDQCSDAAVKLSPAVDIESLPPGELEIIGESGGLVQAVLWTGRLARAARSATRLPAGHTISGTPMDPPVGPLGRYLLTVDAAVERAGLMGNLAESLGLAAPHPRLGVLSADAPVDHPMLTPFELIETMPWRAKRVRQWLTAHDGGIAEIKTRGKAVDPDRVQRRLRGEGATTHTVFIFRLNRKLEAWITRRIAAATD